MSFEKLQHNFGVGDGQSTACVNSLAYLLDAEQQGVSREDALVNPIIKPIMLRLLDCIIDAME